MPTAAALCQDLLEAYPLLKVVGLALGLALLRDHPAYRWLRYPLLPVLMGLAAYRLKTLVKDGSSSAPSLLDWLLQQLPIEGVTGAIVRDALGLALLLLLVTWARQLRRIVGDWRATKAAVGDQVFALLRELPSVRRRLEEETAKLAATIEHSLRPDGWLMGHAPIRSLPPQGLPIGAVRQQLRGYAANEEGKWRDGFVSGAVYGGESEIVGLMGEAATLYGLSNPLHPDLFASLMRFEAEICAMVAQMVNGGDPGVCACLTSGGTESIILAAKAHRDFFRSTKGITGQPEIVACVSAHAAIQKAADLMGLRLVLVPMDPKTFKADVHIMERAITANTVMLYASAPTFGQGVIDPIKEVAALGKKYDVGVHVDMCLGGFILPFAKAAGRDLPAFDFSLPGVTSMSVDTHKYGYAAKGTSVVLYRHKRLRSHQFFCFPNWTGGLYVTPTIAGSRAGALSAACWAAMAAIGREGYEQRSAAILETTRLIAEGVTTIPGLKLQGQAEAMIVCVGGQDGVNIYEVGDRMSKKGWNLNSLQSPPGIHLCVTLRHVGKHEAFLTDLREAAAEVMAEMEKDGTEQKKEGNAAIYGMAATLPAGPVNDMLRTYMDVVLS